MKLCTTRKIDDLGRIVLPKDAKQSGFDCGVTIDIYTHKDTLVLKINPDQRKCLFCDNDTDELKRFDDYNICPGCLEKIKAL